MCIRDRINTDNKHLPVVRVSILVTADNYSNKKINDSIVANDTNRDLTKNNDVDVTDDKIIMWGNPEHYYYGILEKMNFDGYYMNDSHMMGTNKNNSVMWAFD